MKIYHTETQEDYDALMIELEAEGAIWSFGRKLSESNNWYVSEHLTCIRVYDSKVNHASLNYYKEEYPDITITKYKAKVNEKMKFTKENVEKVIDEYFRQADFEPCGDLIAAIDALDDTPEKVVVPKFVADVFSGELHFEYEIQESRNIPHVLSTAFGEVSSNKNIKFLQWVKQYPDKYVMAVKYGYEVEKEPLYIVSIMDLGIDRIILMKNKLGHSFELESENDGYWEVHFSEQQIKECDERYWPFAVPAND